MNIEALLESYYEGLARKAGWDAVLAADFRFIGGDMTKQTALVGREAYALVLQRLSQRYTGLRVKKQFVYGDEALVLVTYDWTFPREAKVSGTVAESWKAKDDQLTELTIFFDTLSFDRLSRG